MSGTFKCTDYEVFKVFEKIERTSSRNEKLKLLQTLATCPIAKKIFELVLDRHIVFNVSRSTLRHVKCGLKHATSFDNFLKLIEKLRIATKRTEILAFLQSFFLKTDALSCKWYKRILLKNLQLGVSETLVSKVFPDISIKETSLKRIKVMLGEEFWSLIKANKLDKVLHECNRWSTEPKYDGIRIIAIVNDKSEVICLTRNGKESPNVEVLLQSDLLRLWQKLKTKYPKGFALDGEIYANDWHKTMTRVFKRKEVSLAELQKDKVTRYFVWDLLDLDKFVNRQPQGKTYEQRYNELKQVLSELKSHLTRIKLTPSKELDTSKLTIDEVIKLIKELTNKAIEKGYEGIMMKCKEIDYVYGRTDKWIKVKQIKTVDAKVVDVDKNGNKPGEISALIVEYKGRKVRVGSGLTKAIRQCLYQHPEDIIGWVIEVAYQEETPDGSLRFPRFLRLRPDKTPKSRLEKPLHCLDKVLKVF